MKLGMTLSAALVASVSWASMAAAQTELSMWYHGAGNEAESAALQLIIDDFNASGIIGPGLDFAEDGFVFVEVDMTDVAGGASIEAVISIAVPAPLSGSVFALGGLLAMRRRR